MITHVAIKFDGRIWSLPKPYRHSHVMDMMHHLSKVFGDWTGDKFENVIFDDDGFLDNEGNFLNRKQALIYARDLFPQLNEKEVYGDELYSENLW